MKKEPWQVYFESFEHHTRPVQLPVKPGAPEAEAAVQAMIKAFETAYESIVYYLTRDLQWRNEAAELADEFRAVSFEWIKSRGEGGLPSLRERLRDQYADWVLRQRR